MKRRWLSIQNSILRLMKQGTEKTIEVRWLPFAPILRKPSLPDYVTVIIATGVLIAGYPDALARKRGEAIRRSASHIIHINGG